MRIVSVAMAFVLGSALSFPMSCVAAASAEPAHTGALRWRSVGPYLGGRVTSVAGVASVPGRFYAAYAGGGIWETNSYGRRWKSIWPVDAKTSNMGAIAVAPSDPNIIYVGTGDPAFRNTSLTGDGVYKSINGGKTWTHVGLAGTHVISWILVDPRNPDIVYASSMGHIWAPNPQRGVYKSVNGGKTWKKILFVNDKTGVITMAMDPKDPNVIYATTWQAYRRPWTLSSGGAGSGIYKSTNGGATWTNISHSPGLPSGMWGKVTVAVAPSDPNVVYAEVQYSHDCVIGGLFRSDDAGKTWKLMNTSPAIVQRAFYYMRVYIDPKDPNTIYLPNVNVFVSHDGGKTLHQLHPPHGDNHAFWINPNNPELLVEGNDGGASVSHDGGKTWSSEDNQPTGQFYHVDLDDSFPFHIWGAQQDRGSIVGPSAVARGNITPADWRTVVGGEMSWVVPVPGDPSVSYGSGYYSQQMKEDRKVGLTTNISAWPDYKFGIPGVGQKYRYGWWYHPVVTVPGKPNELFVGAQAVLETQDGGLHWKQISPDLTRNDKAKQASSGGPLSQDNVGEEMYDTLSTIGISEINPQVMWTGSDDGMVYVTHDGGGHWTAARPASLPKWCIITSIEPSATKLGTAFLSASRYEWDDFQPYLYKTTDYGKTWTKITNGIPDDQYTTSIRQDPDDPSLLFATTSSTVFMSVDGGAQWQSLKLNLPTVRVTDLEVQPQQHALVISTYGRAFWVLDNLQFLEQLKTAKVTRTRPYLFKPQQTWLVTRRGAFFEGAGSRLDNDGQNEPAGATVFFHLPKGYNGDTPVYLSFETKSGKVINHFTLPQKPTPFPSAPTVVVKRHPAPRLHAGMNRFQWNLRYAAAPDIHGIYHHPLAAARLVGPTVVPGTYYAVLSYGKTTLREPFVVELDPRLHTTQSELEARLALQMKIQGELGALDRATNRAIAIRGKLEKAIAAKRVSGSGSAAVLASLNRDIATVVNFNIDSFAGPLMFPERIRANLSQIASQVGFALVAPTSSMYQVANIYIDNAQKATGQLNQDTLKANVGLDDGFK